METTKQTLRPVTEMERIVSLDVLRGFAVLGILVMNIQMFSMIMAAYVNPTAYGNLEGANYLVWFLSHVLTDQKFMTIFSMLFGAGIVLMWQRAERSGRKVTGLHYRRMFWLLVFGLAHAYLLWVGDILFLYGFCGLFVFWFRRFRPWLLILIGLLVISVAATLSLLVGLSLPYWPPEQVEEMVRQGWRPGPEIVAETVGNYQGGWTDQMRSRVPEALSTQIGGFLFWGIWRAGGLMLIGMALFKLGVFSAARSRGFYLTLIGLAAFVGIPIVVYGALRNFAAGWDMSRMFFGGLYNYWASLLVSLGWVGMIMLACQAKRCLPFTRPLAAVGRMAFTNYILQTLICTTLFYGHGFGLYGQVSRVGQILIVFAVWAFLIPFSVIWLRHFRFGPLEWLWRTLSYMKVQPMRRQAAAAQA